MSSTRKPKGLGSVTKRKDGRWQARLDLGTDSTGKRHRVTRYAKTRAEAARLLREIIAEGPTLPEVEAASTLTLSEATRRYFEHARARLAPATVAQYESLLRTHVLPVRGELALSRLERRHLVTLFAELESKELAPRSRRAVHAALGQVLKFAMTEGLLAASPLVGLRPALGRADRSGRPQAWTADEAKAFVEAARRVCPERSVIFEVMLATGLRIGESLGLRWRFIDLEGGRLTVAGQWTKGGAYAPTKTNAGHRTVALDAATVELLRRHRPHRPKLDGYLFTSREGHPLSQDSLRRREFARAVEAAGVPNIGLHGLRHTHATLLLAAGANPKTVSARLGHEDIETTLGMYSHVLPGDDERAAATIGALLA